MQGKVGRKPDVRQPSGNCVLKRPVHHRKTAFAGVHNARLSIQDRPQRHRLTGHWHTLAAFPFIHIYPC